MESPLVSIVIPIYNVEEYVEKCVVSVLTQTYKNLEVILVNDGSTDRSGEIIRKFDYDERVRIINKKNGGSSSARNTGIDNAKGEYIFFLDSDDYIVNSAIQKLITHITSTKSEICCFNIAFYNSKGIHKKKENYQNTTLEGDAILEAALVGKIIKTTAWSKLYSTKLIKNNSIKFIEGMINEDIPFCISVLARTKKVCFIDDILYMAYQREGSISRTMKPESLQSIHTAFNYIKQDLCQLGIYEDVEPLVESAYLKHQLFSIMQCAYKVSSYTEFDTLISNALNPDYTRKGGMIKSPPFSLIISILYKLSKYKHVFYYYIKSLKKVGFFLP